MPRSHAPAIRMYITYCVHFSTCSSIIYQHVTVSVSSSSSSAVRIICVCVCVLFPRTCASVRRRDAACDLKCETAPIIVLVWPDHPRPGTVRNREKSIHFKWVGGQNATSPSSVSTYRAPRSDSRCCCCCTFNITHFNHAGRARIACGLLIKLP